MLRLIITSTLLSLSLNGFGQAVADSFFIEKSKPVSIAIEYGLEAKGDEDIKSYGFKLDFAQYHRARFATSVETKFRYLNGMRSEIDNQTFAIGLGYVIKYHFLHKNKMSSFVDCGFGAIYSVDRFLQKAHISMVSIM